jgi:hypothetical protein
MSKIEVDAIEPQSGTTLTIGASGDTITIPSGATLSSTDPLVFPAGTASAPAVTTTGDTNTGIFFPSADTIAFTEGGTEAMRINSDGRLGIKTTTPETELDISSGATTGGTKRYITLTSLNGSSAEIGYADIGVTFNQNTAGNESGGMNFRCFHDGTMRDRYLFGAGSGDVHAWYTGAGTERMRIDSSGVVMIGTTNTNPFASNTAGISFGLANGIAILTRDNGDVLALNRKTNDGQLVNLAQDGVTEGSISVSGATVSYNSFTGSHWSRFVNESKPNVLRGTVLESLDQMIDWYHAQFEVSTTEKDSDGNNVVKTHTQRKTYALKANEQEGDVITYAWNTEKKDEEGNDIIEQVQATIVKQVDVKHVMSKISDTVEAKNVYGVFSAWDNDDLINNDFYVASVGSYVVRIKAGQVVSKGDLLQSNGDGTAKVQADDLVRASSFAKVLSNTVIDTYEDGSFIVPCSLMC